MHLSDVTDCYVGYHTGQSFNVLLVLPTMKKKKKDLEENVSVLWWSSTISCY